MKNIESRGLLWKRYDIGNSQKLGTNYFLLFRSSEVALISSVVMTLRFYLLFMSNNKLDVGWWKSLRLRWRWVWRILSIENRKTSDIIISRTVFVLLYFKLCALTLYYSYSCTLNYTYSFSKIIYNLKYKYLMNCGLGRFTFSNIVLWKYVMTWSKSWSTVIRYKF